MADLLAVDGEQEVSLGDADPGLGQRRAPGVVPVLSREDVGDAVEARRVGLELASQHAAGDALDGGLVPRLHVGVPRLELAEHFAEQEIELAAAGDVGDQGAIAPAHLRPVDAMHLGS